MLLDDTVYLRLLREQRAQSQRNDNAIADQNRQNADYVGDIQDRGEAENKKLAMEEASTARALGREPPRYRADYMNRAAGLAAQRSDAESLAASRGAQSAFEKEQRGYSQSQALREMQGRAALDKQNAADAAALEKTRVRGDIDLEIAGMYSKARKEGAKPPPGPYSQEYETLEAMKKGLPSYAPEVRMISAVQAAVGNMRERTKENDSVVDALFSQMRSRLGKRTGVGGASVDTETDTNQDPALKYYDANQQQSR